ncbi:hypothetical protein PPL_05240 [Heterostelium album PN500]|uniref:HD domain-containing protein n=1 Tax=Heterostelium pallidum (strain ATCC 26659 / Pp 5 / PN500) TaxID=670386 RepID=D3B9U3_HETP5|nr:hypothetical protein PPL_05240 [Heterostelium album PN500]EFA82005.1 hypothetical protein PPL_05240 [Heterostelium album PN500]|eukprot:XP_020434122.1 hypothetical protein PPL_05240 [Heterostelium album PN500]
MDPNCCDDIHCEENNDSLTNAKCIVDEIWKMLESGMEEEYIGEAISQLEHALQAAASASANGCDDETVLAALLHDIGQFVVASDMSQQMLMTDEVTGETVSVGAHGHEIIGGQFLRAKGFSDKVAQLVEAHVNVKRYLTGSNPDYYNSLSDASKASLKFQGGPFTAEQVKQFEASDHFALKVQLRRWDDAAKVVGLQTPTLEFYRPIAINHLLNQQKLKQQ